MVTEDDDPRLACEDSVLSKGLCKSRLILMVCFDVPALDEVGRQLVQAGYSVLPALIAPWEVGVPNGHTPHGLIVK